MKRTVSFLLLITLVLALGTSVADEISFRGIPWGTDAVSACDKLNKGGLSLYLSSFDEFASSVATYRLRNILSSSLYGNASGEQGLTTFALDYPRGLKVAGYEPASVYVWFVYCPVDGELVYDNKRTAFYAGMYSFAPENLEGMYRDLQGKLVSVYGDYTVEGGQKIIENICGEKTIMWSSIEFQQTVTVWESDESYLFLVSNKRPEDADPTFFTDNIMIVYAAKESDKWIDEALAAQKKTNEKMEKEKYGNGDTSGL